MPELPEVETMRRDVLAPLIGRKIAEVEVRLPKVMRTAPGLSADDLTGRAIERTARRAKMLIVDLSEDLTLLMHMRLAGQLARVLPDGKAITAGHPVPAYGAPLPHKSTHIILTLDDGSKLYYTDIRQFGFFYLLPTADVPDALKRYKYGVEPLSPEFTTEKLAELLRRRPRMKMKQFLLDQTLVAGLGNIYADESLWMSGIHPLRAAGTVCDEETRKLHDAIVEVLEEAITHGVADVRNGKAVAGARLPRVHGRAGEPCLRCGTLIERIRVGGRSTYFCPSCQPISAEQIGTEDATTSATAED